MLEQNLFENVTNYLTHKEIFIIKLMAFYSSVIEKIVRLFYLYCRL